MISPEILDNKNIFRSMKFYAQRKDWANAYGNLKMKNLLDEQDNVHSVEIFLREHFKNDILFGSAEEFAQILKNGTNNFHIGDLRELEKFIQDIIESNQPAS